MKKAMLWGCLAFLSLTMAADTVPFRSGRILAAELSDRKPRIDKMVANAFDNNNPSTYAAVTVRLDPGRKISIFDYVLEYQDQSMPCIAIRLGDGEFTYTTDTLKPGKEGELVTMLFALPTRLSSSQAMALKAKFPPYSRAKTIPISFQNRNGNGFTAASSIKQTGAF